MREADVNLSTPEPPPVNRGAPIVPMVIRDLEDRRAFGRAKYGAELCVQAGRDALVDCYQEALDLVIYLRQVIAQREAEGQPEPIAGPAPSLLRRLERARVVDLKAGEETILQEAQRLVYGAREAAYSHPARDYAKTAKIWTGILLEKLLPGVEITAREAVLCMVGVKLSREAYQHKRDNLTDGAGYCACAQRIAEAEAGIGTQRGDCTPKGH